MAQKRSFNEGKRHFKKNKKQKTSTVAEGSNEEVLLADIRSLLKDVDISDEARETARKESEEHAEIDVTIKELSSTGDGLAEKDGQVYVVPFSAPGDVVTARVYKHFEVDSYCLADFVQRVTPGPVSSAEPQCPYFTQCSGCQFQHMPYDAQLAHKKTIVEKAFRNFSNLPPSSLPPVGDTIGSPLQYGYRTKLTPHFDGPPGGRRDKRHGKQVTWPGVPPIGFMKKGTRKTMDIEDCPIGTDAVRMGMKRERVRVAKEIDKYQKGATLLLRESTKREDKKEDGSLEVSTEEDKDEVVEDRGKHIHRKICITDHKATSTEYVDGYRFDNPAGAFFQNNNSILPVVTQYIRDQILGPTNGTASSDAKSNPMIKHMVDAYCGSGFFTINLSSMFKQSIGIDVSAQSIDFASKNATLNNLPADATHFIAADANKLFESLDTTKFPPEETVVVIDPSRKGCDAGFISQLLQYGPARVCYVSCNVHTQARDIGWLVGGLPGEDGSAPKHEGLYEIESLRGFDFFPQTSHVEGVAILRKKTEDYSS
ncbi:putative TRAM domain, (Uracil-5)-methyltransferase family, nucleic acid-binding protein [Septoria linicola]|nr:putative TRAM domain, (Uracil-5)-methyltransferase family, nucleic acid-binding protein [Septoria linicola]